jgi:uncharacterized protein
LGTERVEGHPPTGDDGRVLLAAAPAGWEDRKVVLGAFDGDALVAVVDLLPGFHEPGAAHVGLLQVQPGTKVEATAGVPQDALLDWLREQWPETTILRAAIVATNAATADPFWTAMGYSPTGSPLAYDVGAEQSTRRSGHGQFSAETAPPPVLNA